jgi:CelD/BcsL family acetyltransferase involved in cellulose biosynthesis
MKVITVDPRTDPCWRQLVTTVESDVFHSPEWIRAVTETYGFPVVAYLLLDDAGKPRAGIPVCSIHDLRGQRRVAFPFSDYYDPLVTAPEDWASLSEHLVQEESLLKLRCLHNPLPLADPCFALVNQARWHGLDLTPDGETLWTRLDKKDRWALRKVEGMGVTVEATRDPTMLRRFFELHLRMRKYKYQMVAQPYAFFENIWRHLLSAGMGTLMVAKQNDTVLGITLYLQWQNKFYYKFNASDPAALALLPNDLMIWKGIEYAQSQGCQRFDFGLSDWDQSGLIRFKRKFADTEKTISFLEYRSPQTAATPTPSPGKLLPSLTALFTDPAVPDAITEQAGELLYQYFV